MTLWVTDFPGFAKKEQLCQPKGVGYHCVGLQMERRKSPLPGLCVTATESSWLRPADTACQRGLDLAWTKRCSGHPSFPSP